MQEPRRAGDGHRDLALTRETPHGRIRHVLRTTFGELLYECGAAPIAFPENGMAMVRRARDRAVDLSARGIFLIEEHRGQSRARARRGRSQAGRARADDSDVVLAAHL